MRAVNCLHRVSKTWHDGNLACLPNWRSLALKLMSLAVLGPVQIQGAENRWGSTSRSSCGRGSE
jgi:hypothetical protein